MTAKATTPLYQVRERFGEWQVWRRNADGNGAKRPVWTYMGTCDEQQHAAEIVDALNEAQRRQA